MSEDEITRCIVCSLQDPYDDQGICRGCGFNFLDVPGWGKFKFRKCQKCRQVIAITARSCPKCSTTQVMSAAGYMFKYYLFVFEPIRSYLTRSRASGLSYIDQLTLILGVMIGVSLAQFIRNDSSQAEKSVNFFMSIVVSLTIIPQVFREPELTQNAPFISRFGISVQKGAFSDLMLEAIEKGLSS
ncbi:hypothetical protein ACQ4M4_24355 [Leptolyngbya sp. AN02str]|uniref:hypothetical protein n=1 Tax=Leptolyngbya sp. AN02str TaxID=3423363 RepID=UPI003D314393